MRAAPHTDHVWRVWQHFFFPLHRLLWVSALVWRVRFIVKTVTATNKTHQMITF